jgi:solute:Na+ symporter, SSS family
MRLTALDLAILAAYLAGITLFGITFRRGQATVRDYFLGGRTAPWWALAVSIVATETSTLTIVGTPALAFAGNLTFLQFVLGYLVGRVVIVLVFLPRYFSGEFYTAYQLIERRFGAKVKAVAASTFLVTRLLAEGVRIGAIALVITAAIGTGQRASILLIMGLVLIYTFEGGMKAVIWTDVVQFLLYFSGSLAALFLLLQKVPGGWEAVIHAAAPAHKFRIFDFSLSFTNPAKTYTFWSGLIGGTIFTMGSHGTD